MYPERNVRFCSPLTRITLYVWYGGTVCAIFAPFLISFEIFKNCRAPLVRYFDIFAPFLISCCLIVFAPSNYNNFSTVLAWLQHKSRPTLSEIMDFLSTTCTLHPPSLSAWIYAVTIHGACCVLGAVPLALVLWWYRLRASTWRLVTSVALGAITAAAVAVYKDDLAAAANPPTAVMLWKRAVWRRYHQWSVCHGRCDHLWCQRWPGALFCRCGHL